MKFICDDMLGTLAKWLRILGYDTRYGAKDDESLLNIVEKEDRILLTRDRALYNRIRNGALAIYIDTVSLNEQLAHVIKKTRSEIDENKILTRCILCNVPVVQKDKESLSSTVPPFSFQNYTKFWECPCCHRIYWMGSHWENMRNRIQKILGSGAQEEKF